MSDSDDSRDGGRISGGIDMDAMTTGKRSRRSSTTTRTPKYKDASSSEQEVSSDDDDDDCDDDDVVDVDSSDGDETKMWPKKKEPQPPSAKKSKSPNGEKIPPVKSPAAKKEETNASAVDDDGKASSATAAGAKAKKSKGGVATATNGDVEGGGGIDVVIPYALLNKHRGSGKGECTMLVQVESNDNDVSRHLDFHGQSGAIGRFEADGDGVILDLKGYQYRGTIRPGPTAMVVALTRDGKFKVEAITDEFVTLDASTRTDVMAKLDAVVRGDMDSTYRYEGDDNVNVIGKGSRKGGNGRDGEIDDDEGGYVDDKGGDKKNGKKRARGNASKSGGGPGPKRRKSSVAKN